MPPGCAARGARATTGAGDDWRVHFSYTCTAGHLDEVVVTDQHTAECLDHFPLQPDDIAGVDNGEGYRASVASAVQQHADAVLRITPATLPVETEAGVPCDFSVWLRQGSAAQQEWHERCVHDGRPSPVRVLAARLPPAAAARARQRTYQ